MTTKKSKLNWVRLNKLTVVAASGELTYVLSRQGVRRGRVTVNVVHPNAVKGNEHAVRLACEVTPTHARRIVDEYDELWRKFGSRVDAILRRPPTLIELRFARHPVFAYIEANGEHALHAGYRGVLSYGELSEGGGVELWFAPWRGIGRHIEPLTSLGVVTTRVGPGANAFVVFLP